MKSIWITAVSLLATGCNHPAPDPSVCVAPAMSGIVADARRVEALKRSGLTPLDREGIETRSADACLQRWAYRLQRSDASLADRRQAVLGACVDERVRLSSVWQREATGSAEDWASQRATFFIVQAEAGACRPPET